VFDNFDDSSVDNLEFVGLVTGNDGSGAMIGRLSITAVFVAGFFDGNSEYIYIGF
jgi:hypothetical protein